MCTFTMNKIFILGLPRTGTTSVCSMFLNLGFKTAHTAYTINALEEAQVLADTPIFNDFEQLNTLYDQAQYIYLERDLHLWIPSVSKLLKRMYKNLTNESGGFNPTLKRCYLECFPNLSLDNIADTQYLTTCYLTHKKRVNRFITNSNVPAITVNLNNIDAAKQLMDFCAIPYTLQPKMPYLNKGGKITAWNDIKNELKIRSTNNGKSDKDNELYKRLI
jgi:hypothetical protein